MNCHVQMYMFSVHVLVRNEYDDHISFQMETRSFEMRQREVMLAR